MFEALSAAFGETLHVDLLTQVASISNESNKGQREGVDLNDDKPPCDENTIESPAKVVVDTVHAGDVANTAVLQESCDHDSIQVTSKEFREEYIENRNYDPSENRCEVGASVILQSDKQDGPTSIVTSSLTSIVDQGLSGNWEAQLFHGMF